MKLAPVRRALQAELESALCRLAGLDGHEPGHGDEADERLATEANEAATRRRADLRAKVQRIELALERIAEGTYGRCLECGDAISEPRLRAMPEATLCLGCQEAREREEARSGALRRIPRPGVERLDEEEA